MHRLCELDQRIRGNIYRVVYWTTYNWEEENVILDIILCSLNDRTSKKEIEEREIGRKPKFPSKLIHGRAKRRFYAFSKRPTKGRFL